MADRIRKTTYLLRNCHDENIRNPTDGFGHDVAGFHNRKAKLYEPLARSLVPQITLKEILRPKKATLEENVNTHNEHNRPHIVCSYVVCNLWTSCRCLR